MRTFALFVILATISGTALCQQFYRIEVGKLDTLFFLATKGKKCDSLQISLQGVLKAQEAQIEGQGKIIELSGRQIENYRILDANSQAQLQNTNDLFLIEKSELKQKVKKQRRTIFGLSGVSLILLAILVL